ncbi:MAG: peptidogalycan biosysnthesis protein, partial [Oceanicaulis sp.]
MTELTIRMIGALAEIGRDAWDRVANPEGAAYDPFLSWDFLDALETSGSASPRTGWGPRHLVAEDSEGEILGALPLYLKGHSQGEYVFDHAWANALERAGGRYYPKLLTAVPFTPATGRRVLASDPRVRRGLIEAARHAARELDVSSWHVLFPAADEHAELAEAGLLARRDIQFVFTDEGYGDYAGFLNALSSRKRKALRKERGAAQAGLVIERLTGPDLTDAHWDVFFECYQDTGARKWGTPYLNRAFFSLIHERMADHVLLVGPAVDLLGGLR